MATRKRKPDPVRTVDRPSELRRHATDLRNAGDHVDAGALYAIADALDRIPTAVLATLTVELASGAAVEYRPAPPATEHDDEPTGDVEPPLEA